MEHKSLKISINNGDFACRVYGNGNKKIIAFHGFGQSSASFSSLIKNQPEYTVYSFDLPFHGETILSGTTQSLSNEDVTDLIAQLIGRNSIEKFTLVSFSIGARLASPVIESYHQKIDTIWLLAPDGIPDNIWYRIATANKLTRSFFYLLMKNPKPIVQLTNACASLRLIHENIAKLVSRSMDSKEKSLQVYHTWISLRKLSMSQRILLSLGSKLNFVLGEQDKIIKQSSVEALKQKIKDTRLHVLPCGHRGMIKNFANWLIEANRRL